VTRKYTWSLHLGGGIGGLRQQRMGKELSHE
jgi:hypothetical protein